MIEDCGRSMPTRRPPPCELGRRGRRRRRDVDELAVPQLEHEQRPDPLGVAVGRRRAWRSSSRADRVAARSSRGRSVAGSSRTSRDQPRRSPRSQLDSGTEKPCLGRSRMSSGSQPRSASRRIHFFSRPRTFSSAGIEAASSISWWSRNGERASSAWAIVAMSIFAIRSSGEVRRDVDLEHPVDDRRRRRPPPSGAAITLGGVGAADAARERRACRARGAGRRRTTTRSGRSAPAGVERRACRASRRARFDRLRDAAAGRAGARRARRAARRSGAGAGPAAPATRVGDVARVAAEGLVAAVAVERDGHVAARQLGEVEARDRRGVRERLAVVADDLRHDLDRVGADDGTPRARCRTAGRSRRACGSSSKASWSKPIENVCTGLAAALRPSRRRPRTSRSRPTGTRRAARRRPCRRRVAARSVRADALARAPRPADLELARVVELPVALERRRCRRARPACAPAGACARRAARVSGAGHVAEREVAVDRHGVDLARDRRRPAAARAISDAKRQRRRRAARRAAASCRRGRARAAAAGGARPRARRRTCRAGAGRSRRRTPRRGARSTSVSPLRRRTGGRARRSSPRSSR